MLSNVSPFASASAAKSLDRLLDYSDVLRYAQLGDVEELTEELNKKRREWEEAANTMAPHQGQTDTTAVFGESNSFQSFVAKDAVQSDILTTALCWASYYGHLEAVRFLVEDWGASAIRTRGRVAPAASSASSAGSGSLRQRALPPRPVIETTNALYAACAGNQCKVARYLMEVLGCDPNTADDEGGTTTAVTNGGDDDRFTANDNSNVAPSGAHCGKCRCHQHILPFRCGAQFSFCLMQAIRHRNAPLVDCLLEHGARLCTVPRREEEDDGARPVKDTPSLACDPFGCPVTYALATSSTAPIIGLLLARGASPCMDVGSIRLPQNTGGGGDDHHGGGQSNGGLVAPAPTPLGRALQMLLDNGADLACGPSSLSREGGARDVPTLTLYERALAACAHTLRDPGRSSDARLPIKSEVVAILEAEGACM